MKKLFIVMNYADEDSRVVAVYADEQLAKQHSDWIWGWVREAEISEQIPPEVNDPEEIARRERAASVAREKYNQEHDALKARLERESKITIDNARFPKLCKCCTFSTQEFFLNSHGYCSYCGGFTWQTIRGKMGDAYLEREIEKLDLFDREAVRAIVAGTRKPGLQSIGFGTIKIRGSQD